MSHRENWTDLLKSAIPRLRNRHYLLLDTVLLPLAAYLAFVLRLDRFDLDKFWPTAIIMMGATMGAQIAVFQSLRGYSRYWPFASLPELALIVWAALGGELLAVVITIVLTHIAGYPALPRSIPFIDFMLSAIALGMPRLGVRWLYGKLKRRNGALAPAQHKQVFLIGAGEAGRMVLNEIERNPQTGFVPAGFIDDDPLKHRLIIQGVPVLGGVDDMARLARLHNISQVLIAIPTASSQQMRRIVDACQEAGVEVLTLPGIFELLSGNVEIQRFRPVQVEDLLAREPVQTDTTRVHQFISGKTIMVTGAGGSIGSELCRQIAACQPAALILLGHGENSVFHIHNALRSRYPQLLLHPVIADLQNAPRVQCLFERYRPEIVFHAAAHKHVTLMELNPEEAVINNVGGTRNLLAAAEASGAGSFVMISTDKAVNPTSVMGATKRVAEHLLKSAAERSGKPFVAVRFGNVLGSRGSVVPIFEAQIKAGGPITVTDPEVKRYFMTIPEAVQLVLQASVLGEGGETFVLDMGEPVKILDLARDMIRLAGLEEGKDIDIKFTGLQPGEKLFEEIFLEDEAYQRTVHKKIYVSRHDEPCSPHLTDAVDRLLEAAGTLDQPAVLSLLQELVPECADTFGQCAESATADALATRVV